MDHEELEDEVERLHETCTDLIPQVGVESSVVCASLRTTKRQVRFARSRCTLSTICAAMRAARPKPGWYRMRMVHVDATLCILATRCTIFVAEGSEDAQPPLPSRTYSTMLYAKRKRAAKENLEAS